MPSAKKSKSKPTFDPLPPSDLEIRQPESALETQAQDSKRKNRNATSRLSNTHNDFSQSELENELIEQEEQSSPPTRGPSVLSQLPHVFPAASKSKPLDIRGELVATEKVSDQSSPSIDAALHDDILGKSPPADLLLGSSPGQTPPIEPGFSTKAGITPRSPPVSPPQRNSRPVSFGGSIPPLPHRDRRPLSAYGSPPAPHLPQPHFYSVQDVDLGMPVHGQVAPPEEPRFVKFTKLPDSSFGQRQVILTGFDGRLNISAYNGTTIEEVGCLTGLSGVVVDATFLTWTSELDPFERFRPLVAITLHGRCYEGDEARASDPYEAVASEARYSTKVHVYSVVTHEFLADLLETPYAFPQASLHGRPPNPPLPVGNLRTFASGNYLTVSAGTSGEIFVFGISKNQTLLAFECIAKFWTTLQPALKRRDSSHHRASDGDVSPADLAKGALDGNEPILTMSGRWLAICPASNPSRPSLGASIGSQILSGKHNGLTSTTAPSRPSVNCEVDSPDADTLLSKVARGVAQEMVKGAKWLGDQGLQAWQNYWKKDQPATSPPSRQIYSPQAYSTAVGYGPFPPTHADPVQESKDLELISIFDLNVLHDQSGKRSANLSPFATFQPPRGCSYLSFSPNGLNLFTSNRKGDYQYIWDLLQIRYHRNTMAISGQESHRNQPRVRQIARYERLSGSTIVDVVWESPSATRFAILTKNKTIHIFDLPPNAFRWPPPRLPRSNRPTSAPLDGSSDMDHDSAQASGFFASAMNMAGKTQPMIANLRGRAPSASGGFSGFGATGFGMASATSAKGSKAVAAGFSKSLGAATETVSRFQHAGESRLHLKTASDPIAGCILWSHRAQKAGIAVLDKSGVKFFQISKSPPRDHRQRNGPSVFDARKGITSRFPAFTRDSPANTEVGGFWNAKAIASTDRKSLAHPLSFAEIDTNAPYQPFHSDRRVNLLVYTDTSMEASVLPTVSTMLSPDVEANQRSSKKDTQWVFGDDIPSLRLNLNMPQSPEDEAGHDENSVFYRETTVSNVAGDVNEVEQIVSTTRRRKPKRGLGSTALTSRTKTEGDDAPSPQEGFFEDDCDVLDFATDRV